MRAGGEMKDGTRLYINITNNCNTNCPFCCMYSGTDKKTFMSFEIFKKIIDDCDGFFELQLEGGEPLLNKNIYLFMEYAISTKRCRKIIVLSNGLIIEKHLKRIVEIAVWYSMPIEIKISVNYWLLKISDNFLETMDKILFSTADIEYVNIIFNVRKRKSGDEHIEDLLKKYGLYEASRIFYFQSYGRLSNTDYKKPVIVQNIKNWRLYASDGTNFEQDLISISEYERGLP